MRNSLGRVLPVVFGALLCASPLAAQQVVTFETVSSCNNQSGNVGTVDGVTFSSSFTCYNWNQNPYNANSGTNRVYGSGSFTFSAQLFSGAFFAGTNGVEVSFNLFNDALLVATSGTLSISSTPTFLASGYDGMVDRVTVNGRSGQFVMDDVTFGSAVTATPEPASLVLLGTGLLGVFGLGRRRKAHNPA